jgi:serine/threonine protein kinase/tetratricopeptide (TPR) repeat protein
MVGRTISHYDLLERVGSGGMGAVYRARDTRLGREVALKFLPWSTADAAEARDRFTSEARAASIIDHPNICTVYDIGEAEAGGLFIAMGFCRGRTLQDRLEQGIAVTDAVDLARQIASGLAAAHAVGVIHRDVKPGNVMVDDDLRVKIVDFGIAKLADSRLTSDGSSLGTTAYMAPEQIRAEDVDARTDVWGFGVLLFQMLTGRLPFDAPYEQAVGYRILHESPDDLGLALPDQLVELEDIVRGCLEKDPRRRPGSMQEIADALGKLQREPAGGTISDRPRTHWSRIRPFQSRQGRLMSVGLAILLVVGVSSLLIGSSPALPSEKSLAVLPLSIIGAEADDQLLADGLTVTLSNQLAQLASHTGESFWVVPQTEVRSLRVDGPSSARRLLGATLAVEGNIVRNEDGIRLTMSLIDTGSLKTLRALDFSLPGGQIDRLQNEVARRVAEMMEVELQPESRLALETGRTLDPEAYDLYLRGMAHLERYELKENLEAADDHFSRAIERDRAFGSAFSARGEARWRLYEMTKDEIFVSLATRDLQQALAIEPRLAHAHVTLARVYAGTDRLDEALEEIETAIALEPGNVDALLVLARLRDRSGLVDEAEMAYLEAIARRPAYWAAYNQLGAFYNRRGRFEDAATQFNRVVLLTPDNVRGHSNLGAIYFQLGRFDEAAASFEASVALEPTYAGLSNLASLYFHVGNMERSAATYERALEIEDGDYRAWLFLSIAKTQLGREQEAERAESEAIRRARRQIQLNPGDQRAKADLAHLLVDRDQSRARELVDDLVRGPVGDVDVTFRIAEVYEQLGERPLALEWTCNALRAGYRLANIEQHATLEALRVDPRFQRVSECAQPE